MGGQVGADESVERRSSARRRKKRASTIADADRCPPHRPNHVRRPVAEGYIVEHLEVFEATVPDALVPSNQDGEVERFECLPIAALLERLRRGEFTLEATLILDRSLARRGR